MALVEDVFIPEIAEAPDLKVESVMQVLAFAASSRPGPSEVMSSSTASTPGFRLSGRDQLSPLDGQPVCSPSSKRSGGALTWS
jgi:hypothetical protein